MSRLLNAKEAAELLGISPHGIYRLGRLKIVPAVRLGRLMRFDEETLRRFIESGGRRSLESAEAQA